MTGKLNRSLPIFVFVMAVLVIAACTSKESPMSQDELPEGANRLFYSSSPYLKQHADNPVHWYPWGKEALEKAKREDKPILVSIGYSSCHWCHVMERESFENDSIAAIMNEHFVNIKVDREERPDIDHIYMEAVQAMGVRGGWPLNVFLTPDQKPFYGGTYFPPQNWATLLTNINEAFKTKREEIDNSANELADAVSVSELLKYKLKAGEVEYDPQYLNAFYEQFRMKFDTIKGGFSGAPKFPMPVNWKYLLQYAEISGTTEALQQTEKTLTDMANGGIYDQIGGGFARYSTDAEWLAPHFEKMLYDNGQLIALYSEAYKKTGNERFREVVYQTVGWLEREMTSDKGGFYSALDADSEGVEGKFYVWEKEAFDKVLGEEATIIAEFYDITNAGNWEGVNIARRKTPVEEFAKDHDLDIRDFQQRLLKANQKLLAAREQRIRPGLDNKILGGWNGLMNRGLTKAYEAFGDEKFLAIAVANGDYILSTLVQGERLLRLAPDRNQQIYGYLEDYAFVIDAFIGLYEVTFDEKWLQSADKLTAYCMDSFLDKEEDMFYYSDTVELIARKKEIFDNVIPASNSQMAINLYYLGLILDKKEYSELSDKMLGRIRPMIGEEATYLSNWAILYAHHASATAEIAIIGEDESALRKAFQKNYLPNSLFLGSKVPTSYPPLLKGKQPLDSKSTIYVCFNKSCKLPVHTVGEALKQLN